MERVTMPQLGETVTEGTIVRWLKQAGDEVAVDDVLFEVSTDKVDTEVPSAFAGFLREVYVHEGDTVPIGTLLAVVTDTADEVVDAPPEAAATGDRRAGRCGRSASRCSRRRRPTVAGRAGGTVRGARGMPRRAPLPGAPPAGNGFLSPVVQRLLAEHGLAAGEVVGSGRDGRITRADVLAAATNRNRSAATAPSASASPAGGPMLLADVPSPAPTTRSIEFSRARRNTAANMMRSLATSAHTLVVIEVDYHAVEAVRRAAGLSFLPSSPGRSSTPSASSRT